VRNRTKCCPRTSRRFTPLAGRSSESHNLYLVVMTVYFSTTHAIQRRSSDHIPAVGEGGRVVLGACALRGACGSEGLQGVGAGATPYAVGDKAQHKGQQHHPCGSR
jgi:hypothetical protein